MKEDILVMLDNYEGYVPHMRGQILNKAYEEIERLREALRFYAEYQPTLSQQDFRSIARAALKEIEHG